MLLPQATCCQATSSMPFQRQLWTWTRAESAPADGRPGRRSSRARPAAAAAAQPPAAAPSLGFAFWISSPVGARPSLQTLELHCRIEYSAVRSSIWFTAPGPSTSNKPYILSILSYMHVIYENIHKRVFCFTTAVKLYGIGSWTMPELGRAAREAMKAAFSVLGML